MVDCNCDDLGEIIYVHTEKEDVESSEDFPACARLTCTDGHPKAW